MERGATSVLQLKLVFLLPQGNKNYSFAHTGWSGAGVLLLCGNFALGSWENHIVL